MKILEVILTLEGDPEFVIELTEKEKRDIKAAYGWKRLTKQRIQKWFVETIENTIKRKEEEDES